ncbi:hypothetical protein ADICYQ_0859 [Cyclobacterium qasimii M12-11B]|uniref:Uncharacterized protein n=1 Tax=Cyclobacterium qasimii M12-11B TaxID=641524 RepID=S7X428_9BACT|nr:hypothetical protein ADICYQ_0859 [Cyclobacterium qasimii M12-11B]
MQADLLILEENELLFFNYFFSFLSSVLGLSITIWIWMLNKNKIEERTEFTNSFPERMLY